MTVVAMPFNSQYQTAVWLDDSGGSSVLTLRTGAKLHNTPASLLTSLHTDVKTRPNIQDLRIQIVLHAVGSDSIIFNKSSAVAEMGDR